MNLDENKEGIMPRIRNIWDLSKEELARLAAVPIVPTPTQVTLIRTENPNLFMLVFFQIESAKATVMIESQVIGDLAEDYNKLDAQMLKEEEEKKSKEEAI